MKRRIYVGVSGFSYPRWKGEFYPADAKSDEFLTLYAQRLESVEINSSFYAQPRAAMVKSWSARTDEDFRFSVKAPQLATHVLRLGKGSPEVAQSLSTTLELLGPRRGPILFQLPPYLKRDEDLLGEFLSKTSGIEKRVFEFRHESWFKDSTYSLLKANEAGFCIAETEELKPEFQVTGGFAYFRLRKDSYDAKTIGEWAKRIRETSGDSLETYAYLRHDETGENATLALRLAKDLKDTKD